MHTDDIDQLFRSTKGLGAEEKLSILNGRDADSNTVLMQLASAGVSGSTDGIVDATVNLISAGADVSFRNEAGLNVLDIALLNKPEMVEPLLYKVATLSEPEQKDMFQCQNLSEGAMDAVLALNNYIARQVKTIQSGGDTINANKARVAMGALRGLISDQDLYSESTRIDQMRAILKAGDDNLSHKKHGGFFTTSGAAVKSEGEKLLDIVAPSQKGTELKDLTGYKHKAGPEFGDSTDSDDEVDDDEDEGYGPVFVNGVVTSRLRFIASS